MRSIIDLFCLEYKDIYLASLALQLQCIIRYQYGEDGEGKETKVK